MVSDNTSPSSLISNYSIQRELLRIFSPPRLPLKEQQPLHPPSGHDPQLVVPDTPRINLGPLCPRVTVHRLRESKNRPRPSLVWYRLLSLGIISCPPHFLSRRGHLLLNQHTLYMLSATQYHQAHLTTLSKSQHRCNRGSLCNQNCKTLCLWFKRALRSIVL